VITAQREFRTRFKKDASHKNNVFFRWKITSVSLSAQYSISA
jgi:hypothetical protein